MEVHLTPDLEDFIQSGVRKGRFSSSDDAMRQAVELLSKQEQPITPSRAFVQEGLDDLDEGHAEDFTDENLHLLFDGIKRRGADRLRAEQGA